MGLKGFRIGLMGLLVALAGCHGGSTPKSEGMQFPVRGVIVTTVPGDGSVQLNAETIPGFMEAMTMEYKLADPTILSELHAGDQITATLLADGTKDDPRNMRLTDIVVVGQKKPDYVPAVQYHVPAVGDAVPDLILMNQDGKKISLKQFRGKVLLMTFVYTRCPLADYCPRMSRNFATVDKDLSADKKLYAETHLLSVSFDPKYDTPKVLKSYGEAYTGQYTKATFGHWDFAAPMEDEVQTMEQWFDLGVTPTPAPAPGKGENVGAAGQWQHSLATLVIGKDGKVVAFYPTKDWTVGEVESAVKQAAGIS